MQIAKIVAHRDYERRVIQAIETFGLFEFIDVRYQAGLGAVRLSRDEEAVYTVLDRLSNIMTSLGLDPKRYAGRCVELDDSSLSNVLENARTVLNTVEPELLELDNELATAHTELGRQRSLYDVAISVVPLRLDLKLLGTTEYTYTVAGSVPVANTSRLEWAIREVSENTYVFRSVPASRRTSVVAFSVPVEHRDAVDRICSALGLERFEIPSGSEGRADEIANAAQEKIKSIQQRITSLEKRKSLIAKEWGFRILAAWESMEIERRRIDVKKNIVYTEHSLKIWGWIPEGTEARLEQLLRQNVGEYCEVHFEVPDFTETDSPIYLDNPSFMKATEGVVRAYGVPHRHDIDPTKIMWLSFPLIFGLIFADVGQGLIILLVGLAAKWSVKKRYDLGSTLGYLQTGADGIILMGIFSMFGGLLFGSFFGAETVIEPLWRIFAHTTESGEPNPYRAAHMLKLSIEVGAIQISLGIFLNFYNRMKHHEHRAAVVAFSYLWAYLGFINLLFCISYSNISAWFSPVGNTYLWIPILGIGAGSGNNGVYPPLPLSPLQFFIMGFLTPIVLMLIFSIRGGMDSAVEFMEYAVALVSHTVSYVRIFALNMVHIILSSLFIEMLPALFVIYLPPVSILGLEIIPEYIIEHGEHVQPYLPFLGAFVGTLLVGTLEGILAFIHALRLHFVEWFSKFYHGGGVALSPFTQRRIHTVVMSTQSTLAPPVETVE